MSTFSLFQGLIIDRIYFLLFNRIAASVKKFRQLLLQTATQLPEKTAVLLAGTDMKKVMYLVNCILLIINVLSGIWFTVYTVLGSYPIGSYITADDIEIQLIVTLIFELIFFIISKIISLKLKVDFSFKGKEIFKFVAKAIIISAVIIAVALIMYSLIVKINFEFAVMIIVMTFSILLEIGITRMFKLK